ncbi:hypothetical protein [Mucilaginibacter sp.]|uniref:hypothetical protein n=1 Tax=Mucilaginibacter sp. TaxID=1882438 RepID=UPI0031B62DAD
MLPNEVELVLKPHNLLITLTSNVGEDAHISKSNYLSICKSEERTQDVGNLSLKMLAVFAFESLKTEPAYEIIKNNETINFLRHLRNAGAHGGNFNFYIGTKFIEPGEVKWRNKKITKQMQGKVAFPDFITHGDLPHLLEDISKILSNVANAQ